MATTIKLKNSVTTTNAPSSLVQGEVAINITDKKVWVGNAATTPIQLLGDGGSVNFTTVDTTNLQVTNIKAKDGTASASIANSTGALTVAAAFSANGGVTLGDASGDALTINSSAVSIPNGLNFDSNTLVIDAANNKVGIGTASPVSPLDVSGGDINLKTFATGLTYAAGTTNPDILRIGFVSGIGDTLTVSPAGASATSHLIFRTASASTITERMRITSTGNVGIGTSSPSDKLEVVNSGTANTYSVVKNGTITLYAGVSGSTNGLIGTFTNHPFTFLTNNTERMRITSDGYLRMASGSGGIQFNGDTAAANALDDYEEGTFTPTIVGTTTAGTGTYSAQVGRYTKVGNRVFFQAYLVWSAHTGTGNIRFSGLPFNSVNVTNSFTTVSVWNANIALTASNVLQAYINVNLNTIELRQYPVGGGADAAVAMDTAASLMIAGQYET